MRKLALILALCVAAPLYAATASLSFDSGSKTLTITSNGDPIVAIGVEVSAGAALTAAAIGPANPLMNIYMDAAYTEEGGDGYVYGEGTCIANVGSAGEASVSASFSISAGMLNGEALAGADGYASVDIVFDGPGGTVVTVSPDALRGGVIDVNGDELTFAPYQFTLPTAGPDCWSNPCQALGDANEDGFIDSLDIQNHLVPAFGSQNGDVNYDACADFNRDGFVDSLDVQNHMVPNFGDPCP